MFKKTNDGNHRRVKKRLRWIHKKWSKTFRFSSFILNAGVFSNWNWFLLAFTDSLAISHSTYSLHHQKFYLKTTKYFFLWPNTSFHDQILLFMTKYFFMAKYFSLLPNTFYDQILFLWPNTFFYDHFFMTKYFFS